MSAALVRKSIEICDTDTGSLQKKGDKNLRKLQKRLKKKTSSSTAKSVLEALRRLQSGSDKTEENLRRLQLLSSNCDVEEDTVKKILSRARKLKEEEAVEETKGTAFTEEDFEKFEKEYFGGND